MNKKLIAVTVVGVLVAPVGVFAASADVKGYADIGYMLVDEVADGTGTGGTNPNEGKFTAGGEVDFTAGNDTVSVRIDADLLLSPGATASGAEIEQAYFAWKARENVTVLGGVFNNPIGLEAEDSRDLKTITHGQLYNILDDQTALDGNNVAGVAAAVGLGPVSVTVGLLNDLRQVNKENSIALIVGGEVVKGLNMEVGYVTQKSDTGLGVGTAYAGNAYDANATYTMGGLAVNAEIFGAAKVVNMGYGVGASYDFGNGFQAAIRYDSVGYDLTGVDDTTTVSVAGAYALASNLKVRAELRNNSDDNGGATNFVSGGDGSVFQLQFVATLP